MIYNHVSYFSNLFLIYLLAMFSFVFLIFFSQCLAFLW